MPQIPCPAGKFPGPPPSLDATAAIVADRVVLAAVDIPYAVVRRRLRSGEPMSRRAEALVEESARAVLG